MLKITIHKRACQKFKFIQFWSPAILNINRRHTPGRVNCRRKYCWNTNDLRYLRFYECVDVPKRSHRIERWRPRSTNRTDQLYWLFTPPKQPQRRNVIIKMRKIFFKTCRWIGNEKFNLESWNSSNETRCLFTFLSQWKFCATETVRCQKNAWADPVIFRSKVLLTNSHAPFNLFILEANCAVRLKCHFLSTETEKGIVLQLNLWVTLSAAVAALNVSFDLKDWRAINH